MLNSYDSRHFASAQSSQSRVAEHYTEFANF